MRSAAPPALKAGAKKPPPLLPLPGIHFIAFMTVNPNKAKQLGQKNGLECSQMKKGEKKRTGMENKHGRFLNKSCQQQLSHPSPSSGSFHWIQTTNPTLCLEKQRGVLTEIHIGNFFFLKGVFGYAQNLLENLLSTCANQSLTQKCCFSK